MNRVFREKIQLRFEPRVLAQKGRDLFVEWTRMWEKNNFIILKFHLKIS